jgi:microcystin-dependent protein
MPTVNPYCVSGAGSSQANGTYSYNSVNGSWEKVGNTSIYFSYDYDYDSFRLIDGTMGNMPLYSGTFYQTNPSLITWATVYGTSPAPTMASGECAVTLVDPYCVAGAGTAIANGTYSWNPNSFNMFMYGYYQHTTEATLKMGQGMMGGYSIFNDNTELYSATSLTGDWNVSNGAASAPTVTAGACGTTSVPTVTAISPSTGTTAGGTNITITGTNLTGATAVTIGGTAVTSFTVISSTSITAATPAKTAGVASVLVTTSGGTNAANTLFTYQTPTPPPVNAPTVTSISPTSGSTAGATSITITGTNFTGATSVTVGGVAATSVIVVSSTSITATTPAGTAGTASVLVTSPDGTNAANTLFTFTAPTPNPTPNPTPTTTPNTIRIKRSSTTTVVPTTLALGEIAANIVDKKIFIGDSSKTPILISDYNNGTVNSVAMTVPTGLSVTGTPITTSGTLGITFTAGYSIPTTAKQTNWDTAYTNNFQWDGGSTNLNSATGRTSLGATTVGGNLLTLTNPSAITFLQVNANNTISALSAASFRTAIGAGTSSTTGTVTSVGLTAPTGLTVTNVPITSSGNIGLSFTTGFSIPTTASQTNWDTAYSNRISSLTTTGTGAANLTNNQLNIPTPPDPAFKSLAVLGNSGASTLVSGVLNVPTYTLSGLGGIKLTDLSSTATGLTYTNTTGAFSLTSGYSIPTTTKQGNWDTAYSQTQQWNGGVNGLNAITGRNSLGATTVGSSMFTLVNPNAITFPRFNSDNTISALDAATFRTAIGAGTSSTVGTVTSVAALTIGTNGTDVSSTVATNTTTPVIVLNIPTASALNRGALSSSDFTNFNTAYTSRISSFSASGNSGSATFSGNALNIPTYTLAGLGGIGLTNLSSTATGLTYTNTTGVFSLTSGYSIPTTTKQGQWDAAYSSYLQWDGGSTSLVAATARTSLGLVIGTDVQGYDADLQAIGAIAGTSGILKKTAANTWSLDTSAYLTGNQTVTLSGDVSGSGTTAITTTLATVPITKGGTGQTTANAAINALLPSQPGNSTKYLTTDGTNSSWGTVSAGTTIPSASMQMYAGAITQTVSSGVVTTTAPTGWLLANGNAVSRTTYSALFTALGGVSSPFGYDATTFNLPDMRGRVGAGVGTGTYANATARTLGGTIGTENETLIASQIPAHAHPNSIGSTAGGTNQATAGVNGSLAHAHNLNESVGRMALGWSGSGGSYAGGVVGNQPQAGTVLYAANSSGLDHTHNIYISNANNTGGGGSHNNMQPTIGINYIIKI